MINNMPNGTDQSYFDAPQEKTYTIAVSGIVKVEAYDWEDAAELIRDMQIKELRNLEIDI